MASEHATTADAINHAVDKASDGIAQISHAIAGVAPKVAEVTLATVRADAFANMVYGVESLAVVLIVLIFWRKAYWPWVKRSADDDMEMPIFFAGAGLVIAAGLFGFIAICTVFDPWTYIAMAHPDMFLAHKIIAGLSASK